MIEGRLTEHELELLDEIERRAALVNETDSYQARRLRDKVLELLTSLSTEDEGEATT